MSPKKKRPGRPRIDKGEFDHLNIRAAKVRKARWTKAAKVLGVSVSEFVRQAADTAADRVLES